MGMSLEKCSATATPGLLASYIKTIPVSEVHGFDMLDLREKRLDCCMPKRINTILLVNFKLVIFNDSLVNSLDLIK